MRMTDSVLVLGDLGEPLEAGELRYDMRNDIAVPLDLRTLGVVQGLQRALNVWIFRFNQQPNRNLSMLSVDGRIGEDVLAATWWAAEEIEFIRPPNDIAELAELAEFYATEIARDTGGSPDFRPVPLTSSDFGQDGTPAEPGGECGVECQKDRERSKRNTKLAIGAGLSLLAAGLLYAAHRRGEF